MKILIKNAKVISMDEERDKIEDLDILIEENKITKLEKEIITEDAYIINASGKVVMPGLINAHTHLAMNIFRATNDNLELNDWLSNKIWPSEAKLSREDVYNLVLYSCIEMIKTGTVMANDMYKFEENTLNAIKKMNLRCMIGSGLMDINKTGEEQLDEFLRVYNKYKNEELISFSVSPHAFYTCSKDYLKKCAKYGEELNLPVHIHFCENEGEVSGIKDEYNTPFEALKETGLLDSKLILAHATFISEEDLEKFKDYDVSFVHNPISNLNLGCGIADVTKYKDYVNVCLGTDGQGSGNNMNLFYHASVVDLLQKGKYKDSTVFSSYETLKMCTINAAKALGVEEKLGSIKVGKDADIIILDLDNITSYPCPDVITNIVHNIESNNVITTIVNGKILMEDRKLKTDIDIKELKEKISSIIEKVGV